MNEHFETRTISMNHRKGQEDLLRQMATARDALSRDAQSVAQDARTLTDWQHHFRGHPWLFLGGAAAIGFLLVPGRRRTQPSTPSADDEQGEEVVELPPPPQSIAAGALGEAAGIVGRQVLSYALRRGFTWLDERAEQRRAEKQSTSPSQS